MRCIKWQFFLSYAVYGSLLPFFSAFLETDRGLTRPQIGHITGTSGLAILLTPILITLLADTRVQAKHLMAAAYLVLAGSLAGLLAARGFWQIFVTYAAFSLALAPLIPLQDALNFQVYEERRRKAAPTIAYHRVRVWGTVGFEVPGLLLFLLLGLGWRSDWIILVAMGCAAVGLLNALWLPSVRPQSPAAGQPGRLPTLAALRACRQRDMLVFYLAMLLVNVALGAYYTFYPNYLSQRIGLSTKWLGLIANIGVTVEIFFMLGFGRILAKIGFRGVLLLGCAAVVLRLGLLAALPIIAVAVGTQLLHGLQVLVLHVAPPLYLNHKASDAYRSSMQGLYTMVVVGAGRMIGSVGGGYVAAHNILHVFCWGAVMVALAAILLAAAFRDRVDRHELLGSAPAPESSVE